MSLISLVLKYLFDPNFRKALENFMSASGKSVEQLERQLNDIKQRVDRRSLELKNLVMSLQNIPGCSMIVSKLHSLSEELKNDVR